MLKIAILVGAMFSGVAALIIARSPRLTVRRWIAAIAMVSIAIGVIALALGKFVVGIGALVAAFGGFFALRMVEPGKSS